MFERFTDRARRAVELAREEAADLGHDEVGTDHLLLGLIGEGGGVAFRALDALGVTAHAANEAVYRRHKAGFRQFRKVTELARRESLQLGCNFIGTEHLLLGLIREGADTGALALADCGTGEGDKGFLADVRAKVLDLLHGYAEVEERPAAGREKTVIDAGKIFAENPLFERKIRQFTALLDAAEVLGDLKPPNSEATAFYLQAVAERLIRKTTSLGEEFLQAMIKGRPSVYGERRDEG